MGVTDYFVKGYGEIPPPYKVDAVTVAAVRRLLSGGLDVRQTAIILGISQQSVRDIMREYDLICDPPRYVL